MQEAGGVAEADRPMAERKVRAAEEALEWLRQLTQTKK